MKRLFVDTDVLPNASVTRDRVEPDPQRKRKRGSPGSFDDFRRGVNELLRGLVVGQLGDNERIVERFIADREFRGIVLPLLAQAIFASARRDAKPAA